MQIHQTIQKHQEPSCLIITGSESSPNSSKLTFDSVLTETLDEVFSSLECKQNIYRQLDANYGISRQAISKNTKAFTDALEDLLGEASLILEVKIMSLLHSKVPKCKYYLGKKELYLSGYLENVKKVLSYKISANLPGIATQI